MSILRGMSAEQGEQVLVVKRELFEEIGVFEGFCGDGLEWKLRMLLDAGAHFFMDRAEAEEDPGH